MTTNDPDLYERLLLYRNHGVTRDPKHMTCEPHGPWYYQQVDLGYNFRMTDFQAALGSSQLARLDEFVARRHELARRYDAALAHLPLVTPWQHPDCHSSYHLYVIRVHAEKVGKTRLQVYQELLDSGIGVNVHYIPVHTQPYYRNLGFGDNDFPEAEKYYEQAITLPLYFGLTESDQDKVIQTVERALS